MANILIPDKEFFSIKEVSKIAELEPYTLRFWESEFRILKPVRRPSGHRKYTKKDIDLVIKIKDLLYNRKYTIEGAKKQLVIDRKKKPEQLNIDFIGSTPPAIELMKETKKVLEEILKTLK